MAKKNKNKYPLSKFVGFTLLSLIAGLVVGLMGSVGYTLTDVKSDENKFLDWFHNHPEVL